MEKYAIYVNDRLFEVSKSADRKEEITEMLSNIYGDANVKAVKLRKNSRLYKEN